MIWRNESLMSTLCMTLPFFVILCSSEIPLPIKGQSVDTANWLTLLLTGHLGRCNSTIGWHDFPCLAAIKQEEEAGYVSQNCLLWRNRIPVISSLSPLLLIHFESWKLVVIPPEGLALHRSEPTPSTSSVRSYILVVLCPHWTPEYVPID